MRLGARMGGVYTRAEVLSDAAVHIAGLFAALVAVPVLVTLAAVWYGDRWTVIAAVVYGTSLLAMIACSAFYHLAPLPGWKGVLRRIDQSAIYVKIAGTYTPFAILSGTQVGLLLAGLWGVAIAGASLKLFGTERLRWLSVALYLAMGWAGVLVGGPMLAALTPTGYALIVVGGLVYTLGVVFFLWEQLPFHTTIWHVFVLAATCIFYAAVLVELSGRAAV